MNEFWKGLGKGLQVVGKALVWLVMGIMLGMLTVIIAIVKWLFG